MESIQAFLEKVKVGGKQSHLNLTVFPLLASDVGEPDYFTLEEALNQPSAEVTEVSQGGSVSDLKLANKSPNKLLVVDGEELVGAKQNRIVNATFLITGLTEIAIPVSCVEQGRWAYRSQNFASGKKVMSAILRHKNQRAVAMNLEEGIGYRSDQGMIWDELSLKADRMKAYSPTGAMADLFEGQKDRLGEYLKAFRLVECQVGSVFAISGRVVGLECFGYQQTFSKFFSQIGAELRPGCPGLGWGARQKPGIQRTCKAFPRRHVDIKTELAGSLLPVLADRIQLQQVILNLIMNAVEATAQSLPDGGKIIVRTQARDGFLRLSVRDFGRGVDPENLERVFQPFFTTKGSGLGMGLALSKSIIEAHRGRIWAENNADGGAAFIFEVPILGTGGKGMVAGRSEDSEV